MIKNLSILMLLTFLLSIPALATTEFKKGKPFEMKGVMTHFYGGPKGAEAVMWEEALHVCSDLSKNENNGLILNRLSNVVITNSKVSSTAKATFICLPAGSAG